MLGSFASVLALAGLGLSVGKRFSFGPVGGSRVPPPTSQVVLVWFPLAIVFFGFWAGPGAILPGDHQQKPGYFSLARMLAF